MAKNNKKPEHLGFIIRKELPKKSEEQLNEQRRHYSKKTIEGRGTGPGKKDNQDEKTSE